jgi:hypothetical protein
VLVLRLHDLILSSRFNCQVCPTLAFSGAPRGATLAVFQQAA